MPSNNTKHSYVFNTNSVVKISSYTKHHEGNILFYSVTSIVILCQFYAFIDNHIILVKHSQEFRFLKLFWKLLLDKCFLFRDGFFSQLILRSGSNFNESLRFIRWRENVLLPLFELSSLIKKELEYVFLCIQKADSIWFISLNKMTQLCIEIYLFSKCIQFRS